jgi:hypothetical protein
VGCRNSIVILREPRRRRARLRLSDSARVKALTRPKCRRLSASCRLPCCLSTSPMHAGLNCPTGSTGRSRSASWIGTARFRTVGWRSRWCRFEGGCVFPGRCRA